MKYYKKFVEDAIKITEITCDVCKKTYSYEDNYKEDWPEIINFFTIKQVCGYNSVFGDGNIIECDICQQCLAKLLGQYIRIEEHYPGYGG